MIVKDNTSRVAKSRNTQPHGRRLRARGRGRSARSMPRRANTIQVALVGCGGRGTGAAVSPSVRKRPIKLVAMADVFEDR